MKTKLQLKKMTKPLKKIMVNERSYNMDLIKENVGMDFKLSIGSKKVINVAKHFEKNPYSNENRRDPNRKNRVRQDNINDMKKITIKKAKVDIKFKVNK